MVVILLNDTLYVDDINDVASWCEDFYNKGFSNHFKDTRELYKRMQSASRPISDDELKQILIDLPIALFDASESLSQLKVALEVIKLKAKEEELSLAKESTAKTVSERKDEVAVQMTDSKILIAAYQSVINRVENEIAFSKELIMGAKKIWDSRRHTENANPVSPVDPNKKSINSLPDYKTPIFGGIE